MPDFPAVNISASSCDSALPTGHGLRLTPLCLQLHRPGNLPSWVRNSYNHNTNNYNTHNDTTRYEIIKQKLQDLLYLIKLLSVYMYMAPFSQAYHSLECSGILAT